MGYQSDPLPCPRCSFPEGIFGVYVYPLMVIDFQASTGRERHKNLWQLSCSCGQILKGERAVIIEAWNHECITWFTSMMAVQNFDQRHIQTYYGKASIE